MYRAPLRKIRTVIVDDEPLARSNLSVLLRPDPEIEIVSECGSGVDAPGEIRRTKPDLLFLDVQMPEYDGFDVLELLGKDVPPALVFVTAYDQYALRAFDAGALDYLLKPFDNARFERTLARAKQKIDRDKTQPQRLEFLTVKNAAQVTFVSWPRSTGSRLPITTPHCMWARRSTCCAGVSLNWSRTWIRPCFAAFTGRPS